MTEKLGGVPEQGLREAAQQVLDESGPDISPSLGALDKLRAALLRPAMGYAYLHSPLCSGNGVAPNPGCSCGVVREMYEAALERPRPALPAAEPSKSTLCFHTFPCPSCGEALGQVLAGNYTFTKPHPLCLTDAEFARRRDDMMAGRSPGAEKVGGGAALPPQTGNPSPGLLDVDALTSQDLHEIAAAGQQAGGAMTQKPSVLRKLLKRIAVDQGGLSSPRAPQSGPWRIRELVDETGWWVERIDPAERFRTAITVPTLALATTICAALNGEALGRAAVSGSQEQHKP